MAIPSCSICVINTIPCASTSTPPAVPILVLILIQILNLCIPSHRNHRLLPQKREPGPANQGRCSPATTGYNSTIMIIRRSADNFRFLLARHILLHLRPHLSGTSLWISVLNGPERP
ncbi:hypothetical protein L873DRAFT_1820422 [Choiromyces venosus 120613-1]|uniref:Uncharacterized protein n=1 Tax=Choiromyces venosus 120613-1 TaxID=1336337 RepID=A0A3N4J2T1_9PEZI|nr:hypothetical protein L873DRAFT_1820422 [Choiromyces venosus 120613-1]